MSPVSCAWCRHEPVVFLRGVLPICQEHGQRLTFGMLRAMHMYPDTLPTALIAELTLAKS